MEALEKRMDALETKFGKAKTPVKPVKPRKPSEYNTFVKKYISDNKSPTKSHKELFAEAAKAWSSAKTK